MIQDTLVDYISSQMKLGVSRDAVKAALVGAGWTALDVEDTLRKVESPVMSSTQPQPAKPMGVSSPSANSFFSGAASPKSPEKNPEPQTIKVSDLVSASASSNTSPTSPKESVVAKSVASPARISTMSTIKPEKSGHGFVGTLIFSIVIVALAALSGYLFWQNNILTSQVGSVNVQSQGVTGEVSSFQSQIQALDASNTALAAEVTTFAGTNQALMTNLSFLVVPPGLGTSTLATFAGMVSGGKPIYIVTTSYGVKVSVKNSSVASVQAALQPFVGSTSTVQITGTYVPGIASVTITAVNGISLTTAAAPMIPATTTTGTASTSATSTP